MKDQEREMLARAFREALEHLRTDISTSAFKESWTKEQYDKALSLVEQIVEMLLDNEFV